MKNQLLSQERVPISGPDENTHGFSVVKETWQIGQERRTYWKYNLPDVVVIFARTIDGKVIAVNEFQPGVGANYLHLPAETVEKGERPYDTATRGLREETGYQAQSIRLLSSILENAGHSNRLVHLILALDCEKKCEAHEEGIETVLLDPHVFWKYLVQHLSTNPEATHGGGNSLKATALALEMLGLLHVSS